jgi:hypothetical protein
MEENKNIEEGKEQFMDDAAVENSAADEQPQTINYKPQTDDMEVHHHSHTAHGKKNWKTYFWEFLMLFLAVFCGFLAENQREHIVENRREKDFMRSMIDDLKKDTTSIVAGIARLERSIKRIDSAIWLYATQKDPTDAEIAGIGMTAESGLFSTILVFTDRTSSQLKNSGGMRLIRNKSVADSITEYWNGIDKIREIIARAESYRIDLRKIGSKIFGFQPTTYLQRVRDPAFLIDSSRLLTNSPLLLGEYINDIIFLNVIYIGDYIPRLRKQLRLSENLISMIKQGYHLK